MAVALSALALVVAGIIFPVSIGIIPGMYLAGICYLISFFDFDSELSNIFRIKKIFQEVAKNDTLSQQQALVILQSEELLESLCALEMDKRKALVSNILDFTPNDIYTQQLLVPKFVKLVAATADRQIQKAMLIKIVSDPDMLDGTLFAYAVNKETLIGFELNHDDWCDVYFACSSHNYYFNLVYNGLKESDWKGRVQKVLEKCDSSVDGSVQTNPLVKPLIETLNQKLTEAERDELRTFIQATPTISPNLAVLIVNTKL